MEQRRLRLGDILDDYCPRERRVTNHAVVAMIEENVKQTRCTTCDAEHAYKGGKAPRSRRKETPAALYKEVLAGISEPDAAPDVARSSPAPEASGDSTPAPMETRDESPVDTGADQPPSEPEPDRPDDVEDGPVHRPLIRATLPRVEGQKDSRPLPEFTVRHAAGRSNGSFRDVRVKQRGGQGGNGHRPPGGQRFGGSRSGQGRGPGGRGAGGGFRQSQPPRHGGRKRSR